MVIVGSAYRHGVADADIRHAWQHALGFFDIDIEHEPAKSLCIGPDRAGNLLEILYLQASEQDLVIHAMPIRQVFLTYLIGERS